MQKIESYLDTSLDFKDRVRDLISRMTVEEKVSQLLFTSPAIERLGIRSYVWWNEALHGVARAGVATMFPQAIGLAATFDADLIREIGDVISSEARAKYHEFQRKGDHGIYKGLTFWSPNINIFRDPRWGRGQETFGEDPYLTGKLGTAYIKGMQGDNSKYLKTAACVKHFAVHSGPESERHSFNAIVSEKDLRETYLPAFKRCITEGGVEAVMGAYNRTNDEPCCASKKLMEEILRKEWGFKGHFVSDCTALKDFHEGHKVTSTPLQSAALAINTGCDLNCGKIYEFILQAYNEGLVTEETIDKAVSRVMMTRMKLGMFDPPEEVVHSKIPYSINDCDEHNRLSYEAACRSMVLLKNKNDLLPLDLKKIDNIAVIGPNADSRSALEGNYHGTASRYITFLEGIREFVGDKARIYYAEGCDLIRDNSESIGEFGDRISEAVSAAESSDVVIMCLGMDETIEGEEGSGSGSGDRLDLDLPGLQQHLLEQVWLTGKPVILVLASGSAFALSWADSNIPAILQAWYPGSSGGKALASILFGEVSPSGKLPVTFYRTTDELPDFRDYSMRGRTYRFMSNEALYPFGYGSSYTKFGYSDIRCQDPEIKPGMSASFIINVKNIGNFKSYETVQLYLTRKHAGPDAPKWSLKGFSSLPLCPGEDKNIYFTLSPEDMETIDQDGKSVIKPGRYEVYIGGSQPDQRSYELVDLRPCKLEFWIA